MQAKTGTYILLLKSDSEMEIQIGRLKAHLFPPGFYAYIGSAFGPGGLKSRIGRHLTKTKKCHWHIDYLRSCIEPYEVWYSNHRGKQECAWLRLLCATDGACCPCAGFGSSDCNCPSHLVYFKRRPSFAGFKQRIDVPLQTLSL